MTIDPEDVMSIGDRLLERQPESFSDDFGENRETLRTVTDLSSTRLRNRIAGYITRKKRA